MYILYIFNSFELSKVPSSETLIQLKHAVALSFSVEWEMQRPNFLDSISNYDAP